MTDDRTLAAGFERAELSTGTALDTGNRCRNCQARGMKRFYRTGDVPVHSCLMLSDEQAARSFPRRPICLGFCPSCGFVSNVAFDASAIDYAGRYEDQQSFSKRFREFQTGLVQRLVERYDLAGKDVVEIGCGKGDFLIELCRAANARGVGIDPRCGPEHNTPDGTVQFVPEYFGQQHARLPCDLLCCRHTLEHLAETDRFVGQVRRALEDKPQALVFFEVPDAGRVWREQAFWDVYYEHCSYFTPGSLADVFRRNRFEVLVLDRVFGNQYLIIVARPVSEPSRRRLAIEEEPDEAGRAVDAFSTCVRERIDYWRQQLAAWRSEGKRVAVWGAGSKCVSLLSTLDCMDAIDCVVDINPHQQGRFLPGIAKQIMSPEVLRVRRPDVVLMMNAIYRDEIGRELARMGVDADLMGM